VEQLCKPLPPLPPAIPACNATNYHEFWCTVTNDTESFKALATKLHVNPTKLCEYNFLYDCDAGVAPGYSIRVPYDQCTPKPGGWNCYEVKDGDTLLTVAAGAKSVNRDALALKNENLDILYGDGTLYPGQQLRLPVHNCFADEVSDCHIVASTSETLDSIATLYSTTAKKLCTDNVHILADKYCDPALQPLPLMHVGMELTVPRLHATPPSLGVCKEVPGYWSCYTVVVNDTIFDIGNKIGAAQDDLIELNFAGSDPQNYCGDCSNVTECWAPHVTDTQRGPNCLRVGLLLAVAVNECKPKPGAWNCFNASETWGDYALAHEGGFSQGNGFEFFCKANRRGLPGCRNTLESPYFRFGQNQRLKAPIPQCIPNDKSACANASTFLNGPYACAGCTLDRLLTDWDGNGDANGNPVLDGSYIAYGDYHYPRGSLPGWSPSPFQHPWFEVANCTPTPGEHICHKPQAPVCQYTNRSVLPVCDQTDSVDSIAAQFGVDPKRLCKFNNLTNCSQFSAWCSALKIPVTREGAARDLH
jgi:hypothetical protein